MADLSVVLDYVESAEYRRQLARLVASSLTAEYSDEILGGTARATQLIDDLVRALQDTLEEAVIEATDHLQELGHELVTEISLESMVQMIDRSAVVLTDNLNEVSRSVATLSDLTDMSAETTREALLSQVRTTLRHTAGGLVAEAERAAMDSMVNAAPEGTLFAWETRMDDRVCDDNMDNSCAPRHGWQLSLEDWDAIGRPGAQNLLCSIHTRGAASHCRCVLIRGDIFDQAPADIRGAVTTGRQAANAAWLTEEE